MINEIENNEDILRIDRDDKKRAIPDDNEHQVEKDGNEGADDDDI